MAAPRAGPMSVGFIGGDRSAGHQSSGPTPGASGHKCVAGPMPMPMFPPWMPMMMPPWMPMFGMMAGKSGTPMQIMPMPMPGIQLRPGQQAARAQVSVANQPAAAPATAPSPNSKAQASPSDEDEDVKLQPDEEVVVEPEELEVFEKVAAMERDKQQKEHFERASSPSGSCHTTVNPGSSSSSPCSPVSAMQPLPFPAGLGCFPFPPGFPCMPMPPMPCCLPWPGLGPQQQMMGPQHWQHQQWQQQQQLQLQQQQQPHDPEAAPVPWSSFAADDGGDDLDKDLQQLITLPGDCLQPGLKRGATHGSADPAATTAAAAPSTAGPEGPAAAAKARSSSLKRIGSTASTYSSADAFHVAATAAAGHAGQSPSSSSKTKRVLRIRSIKGAGDNIMAASTKPVIKSSPAVQRNTSSQPAQAAPALGLNKAGVQKKKAVTINTTKGSNSSKGSGSGKKKSTMAASTGSLSKVMPAGSQPCALPQQPQLQQQQQSDEPSLGLWGDLDSSLSGGDALAGGLLPADDYCWDSLMQESSDDGWDSLLPATDMDFVTAAL